MMLVPKKEFFAFLICLLSISTTLFARNCPTVGQITEALFIVQNKQRELSEYIQSLKKKLTECFAKQKKLLSEKTCSIKSQKEWELSHCALYQKILPKSIKELELLSKGMLDHITLLSRDEPLKECELKRAVDQSFIMSEKINIETQMIDLLISIDKNECEMKQKKKNKQKKGQQVSHEGFIKKRKLRLRVSELAKINNRLYKDKGPRPDLTFLEEVVNYIS